MKTLKIPYDEIIPLIRPEDLFWDPGELHEDGKPYCLNGDGFWLYPIAAEYMKEAYGFEVTDTHFCFDWSRSNPAFDPIHIMRHVEAFCTIFSIEMEGEANEAPFSLLDIVEGSDECADGFSALEMICPAINQWLKTNTKKWR